MSFAYTENVADVRGELRLFREIVYLEVTEDKPEDVMTWLMSAWGKFICAHAGLNPEYLLRRIKQLLKPAVKPRKRRYKKRVTLPALI